jgi:hypothetical protein
MSLSKKFLTRVLEPGEKKVAHTSLHWVYLVSGVIWFCVLAGLGWAADWALWTYFGEFIPRYEIYTSFLQFSLQQGWIGWMFTVCAATILITQYLRYITTDVLVTSKRVIFKTGLIKVKTDGTDISDIRAFQVDQGWMGQFFGYGKIRLDCRFVQDMNIPFARAPYDVVRDMQEVKSRLEHSAPAVIPAGQTVVQILSVPGTQTQLIQQSDGKVILQSSPDRKAEEKQHLLYDFAQKN